MLFRSVLAMTIVATYVGASSFIGGPGIAYNLGLGWVLLACIQVCNKKYDRDK